MRELVAMVGLWSGVLILGVPEPMTPRASLFGSMLTPTLAEAQPASVLERILTDPTLWGSDAFAVFGSLDRWKEAGEVAIVIHPDRVASGSKADAPEPARRRLAQMTAAMQRPRPGLRPSFSAAYAVAVTTRAPGFRVEVVRFPEDGSFRVAWLRPDGEFLRRGVTIRSILDAYGKPEKITTEVVHGEGDRRPAVLTAYHYANGAVQFVESDLAPSPGVVDRVVLDVAAATALIFATP